jgi:hypothetical protein
MNFGSENFNLVDFWGVNSNTVTFTVEYPAYMKVVTDIITKAGTGHPNVVRNTTYEVHNQYTDSIAPKIQLNENFPTLTNWNCDQNFNFVTTSCGQAKPAYTGSNGRFSDRWG